MKHERRSEKISINDNQILRVDKELAFTILYLNYKGIKTLACCSGHGKYKTTIIIDGDEYGIRELLSGAKIPRKKKFYVKDKKGFYYIPEVDKEK